jgi:hypothetical protein
MHNSSEEQKKEVDISCMNKEKTIIEEIIFNHRKT